VSPEFKHQYCQNKTKQICGVSIKVAGNSQQALQNAICIIFFVVVCLFYIQCWDLIRGLMHAWQVLYPSYMMPSYVSYIPGYIAPFYIKGCRRKHFKHGKKTMRI
jgi:hypothetical protein